MREYLHDLVELVTSRVRRLRIRRHAAAQGVAAVACLTAGVLYQWGPGWALLLLGGFLLLGARNS